MHILTIIRNDPFTTPAGTEIFGINLVQELNRLGHKTSLLYGIDRKLSTKSNIHPFGVRYEVSLISIPYLRGLDFYVKCLHVCKGVTDSDVVLSLGAGTFAGSIYKSLNSLKQRPILAYYAIDCITSEYQRKKFAMKLSRRFRSTLTYAILIRQDRLACRYSDIIHASSRDTNNSLNVNYKVPIGKTKLSYFGVPDDFTRGFEVTEPHIPTFLHIATDPERKGTIYFLRALRILRENFDLRVKGIIAGPKVSFYMQTARDFKLDMDFLGKISQDKLKKFYALCTCLVVPSLSEGFCLPVIEAATFGKLAIVSKVGSLPELVDDEIDGYIVPMADINSLAERMYLVSTDDKLRRKMGLKAKQKAGKFKISNIAKQIINSYNNWDSSIEKGSMVTVRRRLGL